ncbi:MAG: TIGR03016 family PEP-CTERM system-associated outer membrane protein [Burkholderiaceae bacterium]|nr:TIGR03016 family PEP-CTERM system-associated outer membrane protein [Burkholderiaceae bacterium]
MTITMANLHRRPVAAAVALALLSLAPACRADWKFTPQVEVRETYTDNVALRADGEANWVTELAPSLRIAHTGPSLQLDANYSRRIYEYSNKNTNGTRGATQDLSANAKAKVINELLFIDANASIGQRDASAFGPLSQTNGNGFATANSNEVKTARVSPYLKQRYGSYANAELRYTYDRVTSSAAGLNNTTGNTLSLNVASGAAFRLLGWSVQANQSKQKGVATTTAGGESDSSNYALNLRWAATDQFSLTALGGYDSYDYQSLGGSNGGQAWQLGVDWQPSARTRLQASAGKRYYGNTYSLQAQHRARQSVWTVSYNDSVTSTRQQFLLPSTVDTFSLIDRLFTATIPDADARRQAVAAYIQATGLPASLANNINYFSNRYYLQKQFQAAVAFNGPLTTTVLTVQDMRRNGLSSTDVDGGLLGNTSTRLNDNTHQTGGNVTWNWRLSTRTGVVATADLTRIRSNSANVSTTNRGLRVGLSHQLPQQMRAVVDVRRLSGGQGVAKYTENAIAASISKQF